MSVKGSSPLTRGKRPAPHVGHADSRLIPAHAGKTHKPNRPRYSPTAHPRSRGENAVVGGEGDKGDGSSPLTRGKPRGHRRPEADEGLIPAHAGKTRRCPARPASTWAHPRSRGENHCSGSGEDHVAGSSPLTRGKRDLRRIEREAIGLIPAHAGKTSRSSPSSQASRAHPRSRGENIKSAVGSVIDWGSSPLTRGKPVQGCVENSLGGLIPAHAGKTRSNQRKRTTAGAHPRSRGENA